MTELIQEVQLALTELLQSGLDTGGPAAAPRLHALAAQCEELGLHTGASLLTQAEEALAARAHRVAPSAPASPGPSGSSIRSC